MHAAESIFHVYSVWHFIDGVFFSTEKNHILWGEMELKKKIMDYGSLLLLLFTFPEWENVGVREWVNEWKSNWKTERICSIRAMEWCSNNIYTICNTNMVNACVCYCSRINIKNIYYENSFFYVIINIFVDWMAYSIEYEFRLCLWITI